MEEGKLIVLKQDGLTANEARGVFSCDLSDKGYKLIKGKPYHYCRVEADDGIIGTIYVPSDRGKMPGRLVLEYKERP